MAIQSVFPQRHFEYVIIEFSVQNLFGCFVFNFQWNPLKISGDKINQIEAVISGSLNFIFNNYNSENKFADIVLQAKEEGYTEPNPLIDLSGLDVMRKILILSREWI